jgi:hypothetical protein
MRRAGSYAPSDEEQLRQKYPSKVARDKADKAIDSIDPREPMTVFLDTWLAAYRAAGGVIRD